MPRFHYMFRSAAGGLTSYFTCPNCINLELHQHMHKVWCTWAVGGHWGAEGQACPNHGIPTLHHLAAMHLGKNTVAFDQAWSCCFLIYDAPAWISLGRIGSSWRARRWVETSVFYFWTHVLKASEFGVLLTNLYPNCNIGVLIGVHFDRGAILTARSGTKFAPGTPKGKNANQRVLCPKSCRFERAEIMTSPQLNAFGGIAAHPYRTNQDNVSTNARVLWFDDVLLACFRKLCGILLTASQLVFSLLL